MLKKTLFYSALSLASIACANACEFHDAPNFGLFGGLPMSAQHHSMSAAQTFLSVKHAKSTNVNAGEDATVRIHYKAPLRFKEINIEFAPSDKVQLVSDKLLRLSRLSGVFELQFTALEGGKHTITVNITAIENGKPYFAEQSIVVNAT